MMAGLSGVDWHFYDGKMTRNPKPIPKTEPSVNAGPTTPPTNTTSQSATKRPFRGGGLVNPTVLPQWDSPFRTYGTVVNGRVVPPANPRGRPSYIPTGGGTWESPGYSGPINTAPTNTMFNPMGRTLGNPTQGTGGMFNSPPASFERTYQDPAVPQSPMPSMMGNRPYMGGLNSAYGGNFQKQIVY